MLAADGDVPLAVLAMRRGAIDFIEKPFVEDVLLRRVRQAIRRRNVVR
jgi:two-component system response regulator FixJ